MLRLRRLCAAGGPAAYCAAWFFAALPIAAEAADTAQTLPPSNAAATNILDPNKAPVITVKVIGHRRVSLSPRQGASETVVSAKSIENHPATTSLSGVIAASVPGAAVSQNGEIHVRGSHGQYSYFLDGAPLPSSVSGSFSDLINPKNIQTLRVYTGGFPAEYGGQLAAVFDVTAKAGQTGRPGGYVQQLATGYRTFQSTGQFGGSSGDLSYFASGIRSSTDTRISPLTQNPIHDSGIEDVAFAKFDYQSGAHDRVTLDVGNNGAHIQIPNTPDRQALGQNDIQLENGLFGNLIWTRSQKTDDLRLALYSHSSRLRYDGSPVDLIPDPGTNPIGLIETNENQAITYGGLRMDYAVKAGTSHRFQFGADLSSATGSQVFNLKSIVADASGNPTMTTINDSGRIGGADKSVYLQDDWTTGRSLVNYGVRYDIHKADIKTSQTSPRFNFSYTASRHDKLHAYYDRLFQPAAFEDVKKLIGNSALGDNSTAAPFQPERDSFYETGWTHSQGPTTFGLSAYYRDEKNTIDDSPLGNSQIVVPFNYTKGYGRGIELSLESAFSKTTTYYVNYARAWAYAAGPATGGIISQIGTDYGPDDHDQRHTASLGIDYSRGDGFFSFDGEYGSGFPFAVTDASGNTVSHYTHPHLTFDTAIGTNLGRHFQAALVVDNLLNHAYIIKQAGLLTNTEWATGRMIGLKVTQNF